MMASRDMQSTAVGFLAGITAAVITMVFTKSYLDSMDEKARKKQRPLELNAKRMLDISKIGEAIAIPEKAFNVRMQRSESDTVLKNAKALSDRVVVTLPVWAIELANSLYDKVYDTDEEMMMLAIEMSRRNVIEKTGGPFGSAIFERLSNGKARLISVGCNRVVPCANSTLHGETVAIQMAQRSLDTYSMRSLNKEFELFTSCEPCAMCLGATLWSGVHRIVCAAKKADASRIGFDEGPVFDESYEHLERAGCKVVKNVLRDQAAKVLEEYGKSGEIYNGDKKRKNSTED